MSDHSELSLWEVMAVDPAIPIDPATLRLVISDQQRASRTLLYPWIRVASRLAVTAIVAGRRICPVRFSAHVTMDRMCLWFLRRFVAPAAVTLLIRHFIIETNLLSFCVRNAGLPGVTEVSLRPATLAGLGDHAVIEHDLNIYRVLFALGNAGPLGRRSQEDLDFGMLAIPGIDPEPRTRRLLNLDIQTALCLMNIPFAFCLTPAQYRRAVHSLRLDASLLSILAALTGDSTFLRWGAGAPPVRVDSNADVPAMVYEHAVLCEYAHARLCQLARSDSQARLDPFSAAVALLVPGGHRDPAEPARLAREDPAALASADDVVKGVTDLAERQDDEDQRDHRRIHLPPVAIEQVVDTGGEHRAPVRERGRRPDAEETQRG
jgi:hypothetical protein